MTYVYHICELRSEGNLEEGYVGITDNLEERFDKHFEGKGSVVVFRALLKYKTLSHSVVYEGDRESCLLLEEMLRPEDAIGWNLVKGGGDPPRHTGTRTASWGSAISESQKKKTRAENKHCWVCEGIRFESKMDAAEHFGVTRKTIKDRCGNTKFPNWFKDVK